MRPGRAVWLAAGLLVLILVSGALPVLGRQAAEPVLVVQEYPVPAGSRPHDAVPDRFGAVWYAGQGDGTVGRLDPASGEVVVVRVGQGSAPHGIIIGPDDAPWVTDGGLNAIVRVDPATLAVQVYPLPGDRANLNTPTFDHRGVLWFTGQAGFIGRLDPAVGVVEQFRAPRGVGPYGIATAPNGTVYFASLAGSYLGRIDGDDGTVTELDPPTPRAGVRRVWPDSAGRLWIAEYNVGQLADTLARFDPDTETFTTVVISRPSNVAQLGGRDGEVWGAERARDHLVVVRTGNMSTAGVP
jgi:virginiamycin B lyase